MGTGNENDDSSTSEAKAKDVTTADVGSGTGKPAEKPSKSGDGEKTLQTTERPSASSQTSVKKSAGNGKVKIHFVAVGSAPMMKKTKFAIGSDQRFSSVVAFLRKMLKLNNTGASLFLYVNSAFVPSPDELVGDLNECFSIRGEVMVHYSLQEAWG